MPGNSGHQLRFELHQVGNSLHSKGPLDVESALTKLLDQDLTFQGQRTTSATHSLHTFAAKFPPQLPRLFINELTRPGELVLDPMAGSGTTLVETILNGRTAIGIDLDPLAVLVSYVKNTPTDLLHLEYVGMEVIKVARQHVQLYTKQALGRFYSEKAIEFFYFWFEEHTIAELFSLIRAIATVDSDKVKPFLHVVFSASIITKSGALTLARDLGHSRPHRDLNRRVKQCAFDVFEERLRTSLQSLESIQDTPGHAFIVRSDARHLPLPDSSVHLIVTSPPYAANAIDYMRAHKFSLMWLGHEPNSLTKLRSQYIGSELRTQNLTFDSETAQYVVNALSQRNHGRAAVVAHYYHDLAASLQQMLRVLLPGHAAVIVVGSSRIYGVEIHVPKVVTELAESVGFKVVRVAIREIIRNARMMPVSNDSSRNGIEARMHEEGVIGLVKPNV